MHTTMTKEELMLLGPHHCFSSSHTFSIIVLISCIHHLFPLQNTSYIQTRDDAYIQPTSRA